MNKKVVDKNSENVFIDTDMFKITKVFEIDIANKNNNNINNF